MNLRITQFNSICSSACHLISIGEKISEKTELKARRAENPAFGLQRATARQRTAVARAGGAPGDPSTTFQGKSRHKIRGLPVLPGSAAARAGDAVEGGFGALGLASESSRAARVLPPARRGAPEPFAALPAAICHFCRAQGSRGGSTQQPRAPAPGIILLAIAEATSPPPREQLFLTRALL